MMMLVSKAYRVENEQIDIYVKPQCCTFSSSVYVGHRNLKGFSLEEVVNTLHDVGFSDADWDLLGVQLGLSKQLSNIR